MNLATEPVDSVFFPRELTLTNMAGFNAASEIFSGLTRTFLSLRDASVKIGKYQQLILSRLIFNVKTTARLESTSFDQIRQQLAAQSVQLTTCRQSRAFAIITTPHQSMENALFAQQATMLS